MLPLLPTLLTLAAVLTGTLHIRAELAGAQRQVYLLKPLTTTLILAVALALPAPNPVYRWLIVAGLACSLAGDIFLMLPHDAFLLGMVSFFAAHLLYIAAFTSRGGWVAAPLALIGLAAVGIGYSAWLWPTLGALRLPVLVYIAAILAMAWQATGHWLALGSPAAGRAALGAISFVVSDACLAWDRFRQPFRLAPLAVLGTYYLAQAWIAWSVPG